MVTIRTRVIPVAKEIRVRRHRFFPGRGQLIHAQQLARGEGTVAAGGTAGLVERGDSRLAVFASTARIDSCAIVSRSSKSALWVVTITCTCSPQYSCNPGNEPL